MTSAFPTWSLTGPRVPVRRLEELLDTVVVSSQQALPRASGQRTIATGPRGRYEVPRAACSAG
jgi:hypothetical protein